MFPKTGINPLLPQPPLSLLAISPYIEEKGLTPVIIDQRVDTDYIARITELLPQTLFVGITSMTGEQLKYAIDLIALVKALSPATPIVFGGIHASLLPEQTIRTKGVDIVAIGEGESVVSDIADYFDNKKDPGDIGGICFKNGDKVIFNPPGEFLDMEKLKMPSWHLINMERYTDFTVQAGRGCPYACAFCYNLKFNRGIRRFRSPESIFEEIKMLYFDYSVSEYHFIDDNFFTDFSRVSKLCELIVRNNLRIRWKSSFRADYFKRLTPEFAGLLKRSGLRLLFVGGESGSPEILGKINKKISIEDIVSAAEVSKKYSLPTSVSFMAGFPYETQKDRHMTYDLMDRIKTINPDISIEGVNVFTPYPGNDLYEESKRCGLKEPDDPVGWSSFIFNSSNLPWLSKSGNNMLENISFIARFVFWEKAIKERYLKNYYYPLYFFLRLSALMRWRYRFFRYAFEWDIFRFIRRRFLK